MESKFPSRVLNPEYEDSKHAQKAIIGCIALATVILAMIVGIDNSNEQKAAVVPEPVQTWPEAGPSSVFGASQCPSNDRCQVPACHHYGFLARFVEALDAGAENPREIRDVLNRSYIESRYNPQAVSSTGDYGICQINQKAHPETDVERVLTDPEYAAGECLRVYRVFYRACGAGWQCCYRYGIKGCKGRATATNKRSKK